MAGMPNRFGELQKAELHIHLEGSVEPETMQLLAPELSSAEIREAYAFSGFAEFLKCYGRVVKRLRTPEDYALITRRLIEHLASQNIRYAEITLSAGVVLWKGQDLGEVYRAVREASRDGDVEVWWILDAVRHFGVEHAMQVAEIASQWVGDGVVAFGIGGDEVRGPAEWFRNVFAFAASKGMRLTAHAGEAAGPESVWQALEIGAERVGHGVTAVQDPVLVRHLADRRIPVEVCITSNVATGAIPEAAAHPVRRFYDAGVPIVLNTDDPALFGTTLSQEYELAARLFGFGDSEMAEIARNGFHYGFRSRTQRLSTANRPA
jgi:aminodeoxyfutalosine deaminase